MVSHSWLDSTHVPRLLPMQPPAGKRILVISPHPDDELLGCGGTLAAALRSDARTVVRVLYLTDGEQGVASPPDAAEAARVRREEARRGLLLIGIEHPLHAAFPDGNLAAGEAEVGYMREQLERFEPEVVMVPAPLDPHPDHRAAAAILAHALQRPCAPQPSVWIYEVQPCIPMNCLIRIDATRQTKADALAEHRSQGAARLIAAGCGNAAGRALYAPSGWRFAEAFRIVSAANYIALCSAQQAGA